MNIYHFNGYLISIFSFPPKCSKKCNLFQQEWQRKIKFSLIFNASVYVKYREKVVPGIINSFNSWVEEDDL